LPLRLLRQAAAPLVEPAQHLARLVGLAAIGEQGRLQALAQHPFEDVGRADGVVELQAFLPHLLLGPTSWAQKLL